MARTCYDHVAGHLGVATRGVPRALGITEAGQSEFAEHFGIDTATLAA